MTIFFLSGMFKRVAAQFTPYSWTSYDWKATTSLTRWLAVCGIAAVVCEKSCYSWGLRTLFK